MKAFLVLLLIVVISVPCTSQAMNPYNYEKARTIVVRDFDDFIPGVSAEQKRRLHVVDFETFFQEDGKQISRLSLLMDNIATTAFYFDIDMANEEILRCSEDTEYASLLLEIDRAKYGLDYALDAAKSYYKELSDQETFAALKDRFSRRFGNEALSFDQLTYTAEFEQGEGDEDSYWYIRFTHPYSTIPDYDWWPWFDITVDAQNGSIIDRNVFDVFQSSIYLWE